MSAPYHSQRVPEPILRAYLQLFHRIALYVRNRSKSLSDEELFDLMDAIHNIPEMLTAHGSTFTHEAVQLYLEVYDQRWQDKGGLSLRRIVQSELEQQPLRPIRATDPHKEGKTVVVVQHVHVHLDGEEDVKLIGVYETSQAAHAAIDRLRKQPGFREFPRLIDFETGPEESGFEISEVRLDEDHWTSGFETQ